MGVLCLAMFTALSQITSPSSVAPGRVGNTLVPLDRFERRDSEKSRVSRKQGWEVMLTHQVVFLSLHMLPLGFLGPSVYRILQTSGLLDIKGLDSGLNTPWQIMSAWRPAPLSSLLQILSPLFHNSESIKTLKTQFSFKFGIS